MRELKFRAWHKELETMTSWKHLAGLGLQVLNEGSTAQGERVFMQFTGLKDKNGVDIYEGDVLLCQSRTQQDYRPRFKVKWLNGCFTMGTCNAHEFYRLFESMPEVIGNIHENPDLLEA